MAYNKQTFTVGQVLTAAEQTQLEENIEEVRIAHIAATAPPELIQGVWWMDSSATPWILKVYDGTDWISLAAVDATNNRAWAFNADFCTDADEPVVSPTSFDVITNVTEATWESVGPTGSGADNIWTALDSVADNADWVEIRAIGGAVSTGSAFQARMYVRASGSTQTQADTNLVFELDMVGATSPNAKMIMPQTFKAQIDSSGIFEIRWSISNDSSREMFLYLVGYGFNR